MSCSASAAITFNLRPTLETSAQALAGFEAAGQLWSDLLFDPITINIDIDFSDLGGSTIGSTGSSSGFASYSDVREALVADAQTVDDATAMTHLDPEPDIDLYINRTSDNPNGSGSATPYVDSDGGANNTTLRVNTANAKALGLLDPNHAGSDGSISFNSRFGFDFDPSDGITGGQFDFIGVAAHEIGHLLGFVSGVDILDGNSPPNNGPFLANQFTFVSPLDLYRYSAESAALNVLDWTADSRDKFLSLDGGTTLLTAFSEGRNFGDSQQASHWKDSRGLGLLDPTAATGEALGITANDVRAFDVIGYDLFALTSAAAPEPSSAALFLLGALFIRISRLRGTSHNPLRIRVLVRRSRFRF